MRSSAPLIRGENKQTCTQKGGAKRALVAQLVKASAHAFLPGGGVASNPGGCSWEPPLFYESLGRASILEIAFSKPMVEQ